MEGEGDKYGVRKSKGKITIRFSNNDQASYHYLPALIMYNAYKSVHAYAHII